MPPSKKMETSTLPFVAACAMPSSNAASGIFVAP
jgi:hypothetical protein